jgi:glycopeptide antibiotics resistance protein
MRSIRAFKAIPVTVLFAVYLYILVKIILFKFGQVNLVMLWRQAEWAFADMSLLQYRLNTANLVPFRTITNNLHGQSLYDSIQFYGNIGLFIPFGIYIPYLIHSRKIGIATYGLVFVLSFALCLLLESIQLLCSIGMFDVDDLILNTAGSILGCVLFHLFMFPLKRSASLQPVKN